MCKSCKKFFHQMPSINDVLGLIQLTLNLNDCLIWKQPIIRILGLWTCQALLKTELMVIFPPSLFIELDFNSWYRQIYMASKTLLGCISQLMLFMNELCSMYLVVMSPSRAGSSHSSSWRIFSSARLMTFFISLENRQKTSWKFDFFFMTNI